MPNSRGGMFAVAAVISIMFYGSTAFAQDGAGERVCSVKGITGRVKVLTARDKTAKADDVSTWADARLNMPLREKDIIATLGESEVRLETADGSLIRLRENTVLELAELRGGGGAPSTKLRLVNGSIVTDVQKMTDGKAKFEFETPTSLAAIRGTKVEVDSRQNHGTTYKTFDGSLEAGAKKGKKKSRGNVGNYQMIEVGSDKHTGKVQNIPSNYRPKSTKLLSEEDAAALTGFRRVILTYAELEEIKAQFSRDSIISGIGIGESEDEMIARKISTDAARTELAITMGTRVTRLSESYAQNIDGQAKKIWEEGIRQFTDVSVRGSIVHTTITQYNAKTKRYRIYSLMIMDPNRFKDIFLTETARYEEFELRVKKDELMSKMDAAIQAYDTKYHDR